MRSKAAQVSLFDTYKNVADSYETDKPRLFSLLDELIDWDALIPQRFFSAFYQAMGRPRVYGLVSFLKMLVLQRIFGYTADSQLLVTLRHSMEMRDFCELKKVPDAAKLTRFKQEFQPYIEEIFERLVELTEPICRQMDAELADCLVFDTTGIESHVAENNPKFLNGKLSQAKAFAKKNPGYDPYRGVYALMPDAALANGNVKRQYINGHFCYAQKVGILTNALGIVRHIALFDEAFKTSHPEMPVDKRENDPSADKEISDSKALLPVLDDFQEAHPSLRYSTFLGDAAFDSYDIYGALLGDYGFQRAAIPLNQRNAGPKSTELSEDGIPLCPKDKTPLLFKGSCSGKNRSKRFKFVCPKSKVVQTEKGATRRCFCDSPCTDSPYGRCVYVYPDADKRLYPGLVRDSDEWNRLYAKRTAVERSIGTFKSVLGLDGRKTFNTVTTKTDLFLAAITQLLGVLLAAELHDLSLARTIRKLAA